ncbi:MAG: Trehalose/maltose import ATP-binding protein MalK [Methanomassiliicoccales archaeon PtaB.Bin215]|nr:MAG: Trehalose/maltose import ATP-binding protein MalK [Methanomassiliicoccales archaeon PtaB.Bin215]
MNEAVVTVRGVGKTYRLYRKPSDRAKEALSIRRRKYHQDFHALNGVDLVVHQGETVGILGRNGSGKSTLLKILTGVTPQSIGEVEVRGKVAALLELGAGFNPDMTGMENIYLNGTMQGLSRMEIEALIPAIVEFADIGEFIDQPVKTYSSGMFVRLAFALAINVDPDVLIVDEALSVGDIYFQAKCYRKFEDFKKAGKTILFVTHDMNSVLKYCDRAMVLDHGVKLGEGSAKEMVDLYKRTMAETNGARAEDVRAHSAEGAWKEEMVVNTSAQDYGDGRMRIVDFGSFDDAGRIGQSLQKGREFAIKMRVSVLGDVPEPIFAMTIKDVKGNELTGTNSRLEMLDLGPVHGGMEFMVEFRSPMLLQGGQYLISLGCTSYDTSGELLVHHRLYDIFSIYIIASKFVVGAFDMGMGMSVDRTR